MLIKTYDLSQKPDFSYRKPLIYQILEPLTHFQQSLINLIVKQAE